MENQNTIQGLKEDEPLTCGIYTRFSPRVKAENYTLENQIAMCREMAKKDGIQVDENHIYQDHHISGATTNRPNFEKMLENIQSIYMPNRVIVYGANGSEDLKNIIPFISYYSPAEDGQPIVYVCQNYSCKLPTSDFKVVQEQLGIR